MLSITIGKFYLVWDWEVVDWGWDKKYGALCFGPFAIYHPSLHWPR